jgi:2-deoxy-D-gluconate 3-dehydrogenase
MILEKFNLTGKIAIVTGCASPIGLGFAMAEGLAEAGADIVGVDVNDMNILKKHIEKIGKQFLPIHFNLREIKNISQIVEKTIDKFGKVDILFNNAGTIRRAPALDFSEQDWDDVMNINIKSLYFLSQAVARQFVEKKSKGKIINTASMLSYQGGILVPSYTASKHAVAGVTKALCNEWAKYGINVNAIAPGYMATDNTAALRANEERSKAILDRIPAGRWGENSDLQGVAVFLASSASDYLNGAIIPVDGGWLSR